MKKTQYEVMVSMTNNGPIYRRVWEKDGRYFIKHNKQIIDVTERRDWFDKF